MAGSIAKAYVQVIPSAEGIKGKLSGMLGGEASSAGSSAGQSFGSSMIGKIKGVLLTAGVGKMLTDSLTGGGAMQQSLGGVETLFKDSAEAVVKNAEQAYKTAGMSANQYMETVTGFSASLLQGLGGDTVKAAAVADMALQDMSDNANKFGTTAEAVQNAYQGFAKQNYTMLDNLKLGYGGTKTEMERLLADAQKISGVKYDISNLSDVYSAIHVIQEELGVTGTTAKEASSTLSGSAASMKAAFSDVLANLSMGRDIGPSLAALQETFFTFFTGNLIPMVGNIMGTLPEVLNSAFSMAIQGLNLAANNAEAIVQMATDLVVGIGSSIITAAPYLVEAAVNLVTALGNAIMRTDWAQMANDTITSMRGSMDIAAGEILGTDENLVQAMLDAIATRLPDILAKGGEMLNTLVNGITGALPGLTASALQLLTSFVNQLLAGLPTVLNTGSTILRSLVSGIGSALPQILASAVQAIGVLLSGIVQNLPKILAAGIELVGNLIAGIIDGRSNLRTTALGLLQNVVSAVKNINWAQVGRDIVSGLINGIGAMGGALWSAARNIARSALSAIKGALGIRSPSRVMRDEVGKWIPAGVAVGIEANTKPLKEAMHDLSGLTTDTLQTDMQTVQSTLSLPAVGQKTSLFSGTGSTETLLQQTAELLGDLVEGNVERQNRIVMLLQELLGAVLSIQIGDEAIARAQTEYLRKMAIVRGG